MNELESLLSSNELSELENFIKQVEALLEEEQKLTNKQDKQVEITF